MAQAIWESLVNDYSFWSAAILCSWPVWLGGYCVYAAIWAALNGDKLGDIRG